MARESPPTRRVVEVLAAVMDDPARALSLAEIAKRTSISPATCLGIVNELCAAGWLRREEGKAYRVGPAMLQAGVAARESFAAVPLLRGPLERLAADTGCPCTASAVLDGQVTVLARADAGPESTRAFQVGTRYPFSPPSGVMFVAWDDDAAVEEWLHRPALAPLRVDRDELLAVVRSCRADGHLVVGLGEVGAGLSSLLAHVGDRTLADRLGELLSQTMPAGVRPYVDDVRAGEHYDVSLVCGPVFDADGRMAALLAVLVMRADVPGAEVLRQVQALHRATADATAALGGRDPRAG